MVPDKAANGNYVPIATAGQIVLMSFSIMLMAATVMVVVWSCRCCCPTGMDPA